MPCEPDRIPNRLTERFAELLKSGQEYEAAYKMATDEVEATILKAETAIR